MMHRKLIRRLVIITALMFCFSFALVPLYNALCQVSGLNGKPTLNATHQARYKNPAHSQKERIVIVELDSTRNQELACEFLQQAGFVVTVAENGRIALDMLRTQFFAGILMDIQMPVMDGYAATREIRKDPAFAGLPIIAMTADAMEEDRRRALESGMNDYVSKPIDIRKLFAALHRWVKPSLFSQAESR